MKKIETKSVLLVGVGGQGTILASKVLTTGLIAAGYDVKMSEVHGMSQRGGTVTTQVRFGSKVWSPLIGEGEADVLVSFETMEAMRCLPFLKPGGKVVVNTYEMPSLPVLSGECEYPDGIIEIDGVPVLDSVGSAFKMAETLASLKNGGSAWISRIGQYAQPSEQIRLDAHEITDNTKYNFWDVQ